MNTTRLAALSGLTMVGALALTGCGSQNPSNTASSAASAAGSAVSSAASSVASAASGSGSADCGSGTLKGEGSSAQKNAIEEAISSYRNNCSGLQIDYQPSGSGAGIKAMIGGLADFAGSDSALKTEAKDGKIEVDEAKKACGSDAWNIPMVTGPIAVAYKLDGVDKLILTPDLVSGIFQGKITTWNDAAIAKANPGVTLPSQPIKVFFRSDESGTTENFMKYLKAAAATSFTLDPVKLWPGKVGEGKPKSDGVAGAVKATAGSITYVEWSYAKDNNLGIAQIDNGAGPVALTSEGVGKAVESAQATGTGNDLRLKLDYATKTPGAYPIVLVTYEIVCSNYADDAKAKNVKSFLSYFASTPVQKSLEDIGYAPLPSAMQGKVAAAIAAIQ